MRYGYAFVIAALCSVLWTSLSCAGAQPDPKDSGEGQNIEEASLYPEARGTEEQRNIRRYLECKGLHCESWFAEGYEAVERRSDEFKVVWDTLALQEGTPPLLTHKLKKKRRSEDRGKSKI